MTSSVCRVLRRRPWMVAAALACVLFASVSASASPFPVSVLYDQEVGWTDTQSLRSLALSSDDQFIYSGWLHGETTRAVFKHNALTGTVLDTYDLGVIQANALTTDDRGYLYIGYGDGGNGQVEIRDGSFAPVAAPFNGAGVDHIEGLSIWVDPAGDPGGPRYYLYGSRYDRTIQRYDVTDPSAPVLDATWATGGSYDVPGTGHLRGMEVDTDGTLYVAQRDTASGDRLGYVHVIDPTLSGLTSVPVAGAMDVALSGGEFYVTTYMGLASTIEVFSTQDLTNLATYEPDIPRVEDDYGYSGIDIADDGRFYVNDQWYALPRYDPGGKMYADRILTHPPIEPPPPPPPPDDRIPEPTTLLLFGVACAALGRRRRRR